MDIHTDTDTEMGSRSRSPIALAAVVALLTSPLAGQTLGQLSFPNSGRSEAQGAFVRGVLYLHSFEYDAAAAAFRDAQQADPGFALAYWGEAMTYNHPIWNQQDPAAARAVLRRLGPTADARAAKAPTDRERGYLDAVEALYGEGSKIRRDTLYAQAMARLADRHPDDVEAQAFYALALMGLSQGVRNVPTYVRAGAIAARVLQAHPGHPGAAHYVIHAFDDPVHAPLGLDAARAYSKIAPDAPHAQHMTTHIFLALGMWDDVVSQNVLAAGADRRAQWRPGHYTAWLGYGLLQQGRLREARELLELVTRNTPADANAGTRGYLLAMRAHQAINDPSDTALPGGPVRLDGLGPMGPVMEAYARGYTAIRRGDRAAAERALADLRGHAGRPSDGVYAGSPDGPRVLELQLRALLLGPDAAEALSLLRDAAALEEKMPVEFGPPDVVKPTYELLGEFLLAAGRAADAQRAFERSLELQPGRSIALSGLRRAALGAGDRAVAERAERDLRRNWAAADRDLPGLAELAGR